MFAPKFDGTRTYSFRPIQYCDMCRSTRFKMLGMRLNQSQGYRPKSVSGIAVSVKQCLDCRLIFADPQPIPERLSDHYGVDPEEYWNPGQVTDTEVAGYFRDEIATAKQLLGFRPGMTTLDVGVGLGRSMKALTDAGFEVHGIEPSETFHRRLADPRVTLASVEDAEFAGDSFDFITFGAVLEHLYSPGEAIGRALKWLKPGGVIQAEVPSSNHLITRMISSYFKLRGTNYVSHISPMHNPFHLFEFGLDSFRKHGALNGYDVAEHRYSVCEIAHVPAPLKPMFRWWMEKRDSGMQLTVYLRKRLTQ